LRLADLHELDVFKPVFLSILSKTCFVSKEKLIMKKTGIASPPFLESKRPSCFAFAAIAMAALVDPSISFVEQVTVDTMSFCQLSIIGQTTPNIFGLRHNVQMSWIDATRHAATMIDY
jgi:hypothetical protein